MRRVVMCVGLMVTLALLSASASTGQDKPKNRQLPQNWGKLGLSDDQKQKIYAIHDNYGVKIAALRRQLDEMSKKEREEMAAVLSDEQKERLKKILTDKVPETKKPGDKPVDKKPADKPADKKTGDKPTDK